MSLNKDVFQAYILSGLSSDDANLAKYSIEKKELIYRGLIRHSNICVTMPELDKNNRPKILLEVANGAITLIDPAHKNNILERFQGNEYGLFNMKFLDSLYPGVVGDEIPDFKVKEATRLESMLDSHKNIKYKRTPNEKRDQYLPVSFTVNPQYADSCSNRIKKINHLKRH